jgi:hypothetical protein
MVTSRHHHHHHQHHRPHESINQPGIEGDDDDDDELGMFSIEMTAPWWYRHTVGKLKNMFFQKSNFMESYN